MVGSVSSSVFPAAVSFATASVTVLPMLPSAILAAPPPSAAPRAGGGDNSVWRLRFYKACIKDSKRQRMLAYMGKLK